MTLYIPAPAHPIRSELRREYRTARMIALQIVAGISGEMWFVIAAVIAGAIVGGLVT